MKLQSAKRYPLSCVSVQSECCWNSVINMTLSQMPFAPYPQKSGAITTRYAPGYVSIKMMSVVVPAW